MFLKLKISLLKILILYFFKKTKFYKLDKNFQREKLVGIKNLSVFQIKSSMLPKLLRYADRLSMKHSLEVSPYLDHDLVEFSLAFLIIKN